jgi:hypothetical protein
MTDDLFPDDDATEDRRLLWATPGTGLESARKVILGSNQ